MTMKSILLGSAAAIAATSSVQAADAIIAAEPEPTEYVRVCDAFGTGFFYIPGTETCLRIGGYVRFQTNFGPRESAGRWEGKQSTSDWDAFARAQLILEAKNDTEYGALTSYIAIQADTDNDAHNNFKLDEAYIQLAGLRAGHFASWWDKGLNGETDISGNDTTVFNSISYTYDAGAFQAGIAIDELEGLTSKNNGVGVEGIVSVSLGGASFDLLGGYDTEVKQGAIRGLVSADLGPGVLQGFAVWSSDPNSYWSTSKWSVAASYRLNVTDRLAITPGAQYFGDLRRNVLFNAAWRGAASPNESFGNGNAWKVGVTADYKITEGLDVRTTVNYVKVDYNDTFKGSKPKNDDYVSGFVRLQRSF
ncbi:porin [Ensifer sp. ZNC0028]|uniref:porin n=1 Tax=Ensifer sp. ZNC0028 TaxID=1339236 RepID=UPI0005BA11F0|nr:porin [Ensifer sp. ZNC0028]